VIKLDGTRISLIDRINTGILKLNEKYYAFLKNEQTVKWLNEQIGENKISFSKHE